LTPLCQLITRLARENPRWGVVRMVGELHELGYEVSARTVRRYRQRALRRPPSQSWCTFLHNHASIWAADPFTMQTLTLRTVYALPHPRPQAHRPCACHAAPDGTVDLATGRRSDALGRTAPVSHARPRPLLWQPLHATGCPHWDHDDRDTDTRPHANAVAERVIGTLRRECLDHLIVLNERHHLHVLREYVEHYNRKRPHRALAPDSPDGRSPPPLPESGRVVSRPVLGGLHQEYEWAA
jgi:transposase InsO family protein